MYCNVTVKLKTCFTQNVKGPSFAQCVGRNNHYKLKTQLTQAIPQTLDGQNTSTREVTKLDIIDPHHIIAG